MMALTYVVDNNADTDDLGAYTLSDGTNTLRKCIRLANANAGADIINFNLPGSTVITNSVAGGGAWFTITSPLTIAGFTQTGAAAGAPLIELDGNASGRWYCFSLEAGADASDISGLIMYGTNIGLRVANSDGHTFSGNFIGVNAAGTAEAANPITEIGIRLESSSNNTIGGTGGTIDQNLISECNPRGISIQGTSSDNTIVGNIIGLDITGTLDIGNSQTGIWAQNCTDLIIGGNTTNHQNIISGNNQQGIFFDNCDDAVIQGNIIGLGADISTDLGNGLQGMSIIGNSDGVQIGGSASGERNYISGNDLQGINVENSDNIIIQGNYIGVEQTGNLDRGNTGTGINANNCEVLTIGGDAAGEGNVISGNATAISAYGTDARNTTIQGNMIGVSADGNTAVGNSLFGIEMTDNEDSQIGGTATLARNVIANNSLYGIQLTSSPRTVIENNYIGVDGTGLIDMGNGLTGVYVVNSADVEIGGTTRASRNVISGNVGNGISIDGTSTGTIIKANFIGVGVNGSTEIPNDEHGILNSGTADGMIVGGATDAERNVISGNGRFNVNADPDDGITGDGVRLIGTDNHLIQNNYIGTDSTGTIGIGNHWGGVSINDDSDNNDVFDNLVADNRNEGIWIYNGCDNNELYRNIVGVGTDGSNLGNWDFGIYIHTGSSQNNIVGGSAANANVIAYTRGERPGLDGDGVIIGTGSDFNQITFNSIYCNAGEGIVVEGTGNESVAAPIVVASNANDINGTGTNGMTVHIYRNNTSGTGCNCEGEVYVGSTVVAGGVWSFTHNLGLNTGQADAVSATQTTTNNSTSAFSTCSSPLPVTYIQYQASELDGNILLEWATSQELNNSHFVIQVSADGHHFEEVAQIEGKGNSTSITQYAYTIDDTFEDVVYIQIIQVDFDNTQHPGQVMALYLDGIGASAQYYHNMLHVVNPQDVMTVSIISVEGKELWRQDLNKKGNYEFPLRNIANGIYLVRLVSIEGVEVEKIWVTK